MKKYLLFGIFTAMGVMACYAANTNTTGTTAAGAGTIGPSSTETAGRSSTQTANGGIEPQPGTDTETTASGQTYNTSSLTAITPTGTVPATPEPNMVNNGAAGVSPETGAINNGVTGVTPNTGAINNGMTGVTPHTGTVNDQENTFNHGYLYGQAPAGSGHADNRTGTQKGWNGNLQNQ